MGIYEELGLRRVVNAAATLTRLGGSLMPPQVLAAIEEAAHMFVDLHQLQERVGARIAARTHNEACYVSCGAAAGVAIGVAACIAGCDPEALASFPHIAGRKNQVIVLRSQRNGYDYAIRQTGARLVEVGTHTGATRADLEAALGSHTACVVWFAGAPFAHGPLSLEESIALAHEQGVPVLVDAAAQIPPIANLWHFTQELGADLAIFSGGKGLRGPQSSGLVLGRAELIAACRANGSPNHSIGRPMKVGKEEMAGLLAAVELALTQDEPALLAHYEAIVQYWIAGLRDLPGVSLSRGYPSEAGQPHGRAIVTFTAGMRQRDDVVAALWSGDPAVAVSAIGEDAIALNPQTIEPGEEALVLAALRQALGA